ncbi:MAG TPA: HD domain-containing protein [Steroidobacteraceae bacterium]|nr:HD domain-containing protein [Steroidobacteraceae bacterium]
MHSSLKTRRWAGAAALLIGAAGAILCSIASRSIALPAAAPADAQTAPAAPPAPLAPVAPAATDWHASVRDLAAKHFKNPAWGYSHCRRDYALARELAAADHVTLDDDVLFAAAYLHDMAAFKPWEKPKLDHSDVAADIVGTVLQGTGFPMAKLDAVRGAIRTHMYYRDPVGPEALYLHDADALDWLGAIGIARVTALVDPEGGNPDGPKAVKMLEDNLRSVPARVFSPAGKAMVPTRKAELEAYLRDLRRESQDLQTL